VKYPLKTGPGVTWGITERSEIKPTPKRIQCDPRKVGRNLMKKHNLKNIAKYVSKKYSIIGFGLRMAI
jgi:hypothetical protein